MPISTVNLPSLFSVTGAVNVYRQDARSQPGFPWCTGFVEPRIDTRRPPSWPVKDGRGHGSGAANRTSPAAALLASSEKLYQAREETTVEQRAQAVDEIAVVKIWPLPRPGVRVFDPHYIPVEFRQDTEGE